MIVVLSEFNTKQNSWYTNDSTNFKGSEIDFLMSILGFHQTIDKLTYFFNNSSFCIDLIFTSKPKLVIEPGVHSSLNENCHQQLPYMKINLNVFYSPPNERELRHYKRVNLDLIQKKITDFD